MESTFVTHAASALFVIPLLSFILPKYKNEDLLSGPFIVIWLCRKLSTHFLKNSQVSTSQGKSRKISKFLKEYNRYSRISTYAWTWWGKNDLLYFYQSKIAVFSSVYLAVVSYLRRNIFYYSKGQIISKANLEVFIWTKKQTKIFLFFCPRSLKWVKSKKEYKLLHWINN